MRLKRPREANRVQLACRRQPDTLPLGERGDKAEQPANSMAEEGANCFFIYLSSCRVRRAQGMNAVPYIHTGCVVAPYCAVLIIRNHSLCFRLYCCSTVQTWERH